MTNISWSKEQNQKKLQTIYGVKFPDSLFWLHEFLVKCEEKSDRLKLSSIGMRPAGVLKLLLSLSDVSDAKFTHDALLYWRFYRDVPEFFTCFHGECDGQHWGLLLDDPTQGFRGVASYYNNDGDTIDVYSSVLDALISRCKEQIEGCQELICESEDDEEIFEYQQQINDFDRFYSELESFIASNSIEIDEGRERGIYSDTGLGIVPPLNFNQNKHREAIAALTKGRSLWYWGGAKNSEKAYKLMRKAYELLKREELVRILDIHYCDRNLPSVDILVK